LSILIATAKQIKEEAKESQIILVVPPLGQRRQGGEPAPEIRIDPVASAPRKARGLCALQDALLTICFFL
jgi:hypothetical protein